MKQIHFPCDGMGNYSTRNNMHFAKYSNCTQRDFPIFIDMVRIDNSRVHSKKMGAAEGMM